MPSCLGRDRFANEIRTCVGTTHGSQPTWPQPRRSRNREVQSLLERTVRA